MWNSKFYDCEKRRERWERARARFLWAAELALTRETTQLILALLCNVHLCSVHSVWLCTTLCATALYSVLVQHRIQSNKSQKSSICVEASLSGMFGHSSVPHCHDKHVQPLLQNATSCKTMQHTVQWGILLEPGVEQIWQQSSWRLSNGSWHRVPASHTCHQSLAPSASGLENLTNIRPTPVYLRTWLFVNNCVEKYSCIALSWVFLTCW